MEDFLTSVRNSIRQRTIPWEGAVRASTITENHLLKIQSVSKAKKDADKREIVESDLDGYRILFVGEPGNPSVLESASNRSDVVQYVLVLLGDLLEKVPALGPALYKNTNPYTNLLPLISRSNNNPEDTVSFLTASVLATMMESSKDESPATKEALPILLTYLSSLVKSPEPAHQDIAISHYSKTLYSRTTRQKFWDLRSDTVAPLFGILKAAGGDASSARVWSGNTTVGESGFEGPLQGDVGLQLLYHVLLVIWQLSFDAEEVGDDMADLYDVVGTFTNLLRLSSKPKTTRLLVATLLNMIKANEDTLLPAAVLARLPGLLENLSKKKQQLNDQELQHDLSELMEMLDDYAKDKTTFDEYVAEVRAGHLRWSPPHKNEEFWQENARKIVEFNHGELLQKLAEIMSKPWENDRAVLAIACNDIGYMVREVPDRRPRMEKLGLKARIMELMADENENIRWYSLRTLADWLKFSFEK
ncbi:ARM repeat-containing protein [Zalerion maritima]|uniref:V-type proton ATPase subunit H n=1 Tax=Zalerion maritima TaxID=339359 RepID=A0AAD5RKU6_9PEZI|nr:ARM repeat-containing protein [Zalerion maritima]